MKYPTDSQNPFAFPGPTLTQQKHTLKCFKMEHVTSLLLVEIFLYPEICNTNQRPRDELFSSHFVQTVSK